MSIKRFFAKTTSEALRKVRDVLGPEGVILSNRPVDGGIEILALRQDELVAGEIGHERAARRDGEGERQRGDAAARSEILADEVREDGDQGGEDSDEKKRSPAIRGGRLVYRETCGRRVGGHAAKRLGPR